MEKKLNITYATSLYIDSEEFKIEDYYHEDVLQIIQLKKDCDGDFYGKVDVCRGISNICMDIVIHQNNEKEINLIEQYSERFFYINGFLSLIYSSELFQGAEIDIIKGKNIPFREGMLAMSTPSCINVDRLFFEILNINNFNLQLDDIYILHQDIENFLSHSVNSPRMKKSGRPQHSIKSLILAIGEETFKHNPQQSTNKLATAIYDYIEKIYFEEYGTISQRAVNDYLKDAKIGKENARNRSKVIIKDPFKSE